MSTHKTHGQKKESILAAATKVAREGGLRSANVRAVAHEAGTSPASVLYYFNSMDELMNRALEHVMDQFYVDRRIQIQDLQSPPQKIAELIRLGVPDEVTEDMRLLYEISVSLAQFPQFGPRLRAIHDEQLEMYREVIAQGVLTGDFRPLPDVPTVSRNLLAIEDTYDFYPIIGMTVDRAELRQNLRAYAEVALQCTLP
jgi:AcrR family transcriptional regulator